MVIIWVLWYYPIYLRFEKEMQVSCNSDTPKSSLLNGIFHYKSSILGGTPMTMETPEWEVSLVFEKSGFYL